jgi:hypothetical protein
MQHRVVRVAATLALALGVLFALAGPASAGEYHHHHWGKGKIRAFHNSPDTPAVDIWVDGAKAAGPISYGTVTPYLKVARGWHKVEVKVAPSGRKTPAALKAKVKVGRTPLTVAAIGSLKGDGKSLRLKVLKDRGIHSKKNGRVRVAHTSPDAPAVDIQAKVDGKWANLIEHLRFGRTRSVTVPAGTYDLRIVAAGTDTVVKELPGVKVEAGVAVTAWAVGFLTPEGGAPGFDVKLTINGA